ncbi:MAG: GPW/gp25 family protein [Nitrosomonas sp.]|nr:GPW/gp25 family protein [Nitrosomonas sp.]
MATFSKDLFLPSLLDRLTNEDPVNQLINKVKQEIRQTQQDLNKLISSPGALSAEKQREQQYQLQQQLIGLQAQYNTLSASVSAKHDIKSCVKRDLEWLFNATQYAPNQELHELLETARSVINFGIPDFSGKTVSGLDMAQLERLLLQAIIDFEPRIIRKTLTVKVIADQNKKEHNVLFLKSKEKYVQNHCLYVCI